MPEPTDEVRSEERLFEMIARWQGAAVPDDRLDVEADILQAFEVTAAVFVLDMKGFSRAVHTFGIFKFLALINHMRTRVVPEIEKRGGTVVKYIADDVVAIFPTADDALEAAIVMAAPDFGFDENAPGLVFDVSIGIGYGPILHVPGVDLWGDQMNQAFKLGEDLASPGEVMITKAVYDALSETPDAAPIEVTISGLLMDAFLIKQDD